MLCFSRRFYKTLEIIMKCLALMFLHEIFYNSQFIKCKYNSTHSYNSKKLELKFLLILFFHDPFI